MAGLIQALRQHLALWLWPEREELAATSVALASATRDALATLRDDIRLQAGALVDLRDEVEALKIEVELLDAKAAA